MDRTNGSAGVRARRSTARPARAPGGAGDGAPPAATAAGRLSAAGAAFAGNGASAFADEIATRAKAIGALNAAGVPFMVAGAYAFFVYTGIFRDTKDLDLMLLERDLPEAFRALQRSGFHTELLDPGWIAKAYVGESFVDLIFSSSNGLAVVDDLWFSHARPAEVLGEPCRLAPVEEIIFTKAFVEERERYDGADINHLIYACGEEMDWERLLARFGPHWEVLFAHVTLYRFVYPGARRKVPDWLVNELCRRILAQTRAGDAAQPVCRGHLLSTRQYRHDYESLGLMAAAACAPPVVGEGDLARKRRRGGGPRLVKVALEDAGAPGEARRGARLRKPS